MCHYCGCRQLPLIRDYVAEHERSLDLGADAVRALGRGDVAAARRLLDGMATELAAHWEGEEKGIFAVMGTEPEYAAYIEPLVDEHRDLAALLTEVDLADPADQARIREAIEDLREHISKEEDGLFPAALTALGGAQWDLAMDAWAAAHPGRQPIPD